MGRDDIKLAMKKLLFTLAISATFLSLLLLYKNIQVEIASQNSTSQSIGIINTEKKELYANYHSAYIRSSAPYGDLENTKSLIAVNDKIYGGIVSHHFFIAPKIAEFFSGLKNQQIETIVILGPNHFNTGEGNIQISKYPYITPWGILEPDKKIIGNLIEKNFIENKEMPFEREHSISVLVGFAKYFLPKAKIVPIILKRKTSAKEAEQLAHALNEILSEKSIVIASVDFSHHLNSVAADFHDEFSLSVIKSFGYDRLYNLELDSPATLHTLLKYLENRGSKKIFYENINSAEFSRHLDMEDVTSYTFAYFSKGEAEKENKISLLSFGDTIFDRNVKKIIDKGKNPFEKILGAEENFFKGTDFVSINLEGPITDSENCQPKIVSFKFPPETAKLLRENKINLVNLANNHTYDCFIEGKKDTQKYLDISHIGYFGASDKVDESYTVKKAGDKKIAFVGINDTLNNSDLKNFYRLVKSLKEKNDYVIVNIHWGNEYAKNPSERQIIIAHVLIDHGADVIIGHHPHVIQPMEIYRNKVIFYSLGNFIFDQTLEEARKGIGVGVILDENKFSFYIFPYKIVGNQPEILSYATMKEFCDKFLNDNKTSKPCYFEK